MKIQLLKAAAFALLQSALVCAHEGAAVGEELKKGIAVGATRISVAEYVDTAIDEDRRTRSERTRRFNDRRSSNSERHRGGRRSCHGPFCDDDEDAERVVSAGAEDIAIDEDRRNNDDRRASRGNLRDGRRQYRGTAGVPGRRNEDQPYWPGNEPQPRRRSRGRLDDDYLGPLDDRDGRRQYRGTAGVPGRRNEDQPYWPSNEPQPRRRSRGPPDDDYLGPLDDYLGPLDNDYLVSADAKDIANSADFDASKTNTKPEAKPEVTPDVKLDAKQEKNPSKKSSNKIEKASSKKNLRTTAAIE